MKIAIVSFGLLVAGFAPPDEQQIEIKDLPKAVVAAVKAKFPAARITEAGKEVTDGKTVYEVVIKDQEQTIDLAVSPEGKILEIEQTIASSELPKPVTAALEAKYPEAKIKKAEQVVKSDEKTFEVVLAIPGKDDVEVKLSPQGKILADKKADEGGQGKETDDGSKQASEPAGKKKG